MWESRIEDDAIEGLDGECGSGSVVGLIIGVTAYI